MLNSFLRSSMVRVSFYRSCVKSTVISVINLVIIRNDHWTIVIISCSSVPTAYQRYKTQSLLKNGVKGQHRPFQSFRCVQTKVTSQCVLSTQYLFVCLFFVMRCKKQNKKENVESFSAGLINTVQHYSKIMKFKTFQFE